MSYFVLGSTFDVGIGQGPDLPGTPWYLGRAITIDLPETLDYKLRVEAPFHDFLGDEEDGEEGKGPLIVPPSDPGTLYSGQAYPVMRTDLLEVLKRAGVDNLETFPARLIDEVNNKVHTNYVAFNVIGLVAAADLEKSKLMPHATGVTMLGTDFDSLAIDKSKAHGLLMFRLAESCSAIVVHECIKKAVEAAKIPGIIFHADGEWSG
jgi:hypothetical protein